MSKPKIEAGEGWRILGPDEMPDYRQGDEGGSVVNGKLEWILTTLGGTVVNARGGSHDAYRRRTTSAAPKDLPSAFPTLAQSIDQSAKERRERIAVAVYAAMFAANPPATTRDPEKQLKIVAETAALAADALIAALDAPTTEGAKR